MICWFSSFLIVTGCQPKYIELKKDTFFQLNSSDVKEVDIVSTGAKASKNPADWKGKYRNIFPIYDSNRINIIFDCIRSKSSFFECPPGHEIPFNKITFRTEKTIYYMGIGWGDEAVGDWWRSPELLNHFKQWGLKPL